MKYSIAISYSIGSKKKILLETRIKLLYKIIWEIVKIRYKNKSFVWRKCE